MRNFFICVVIFVISVVNVTYAEGDEKITRSDPIVCSCGLNSLSRIAGGLEPKKYQFPWMVALCLGSPCNYYNQYCGATLINNLYCLTAAHCVQNLTESAVSVSLGDLDLATTTEKTSEQRGIAQIIRHRKYQPGTEIFDIALLKLSSPVTINTKLQPVCLPSSAINLVGKSATAVGWGATTTGGLYPVKLRYVSVKVISNKECQTKFSKGKIVNTMLCAHGDGKDTCQGDSGGPLIIYESGKWQIIGITSFGIGCGKNKYPGVYTKVYSLISWIKDNTADAEQCI